MVSILVRADRRVLAVVVAVLGNAGCVEEPRSDRITVSGYVEATEVRVASEVAGRLVELLVDEGDVVAAGDRVARLDTTDVELALRAARAEQRQADAQLRLLQAGARSEDIHHAEAQVAARVAELKALRADCEAAEADLERFEALLDARAGSRKQRDDAATAVQRMKERIRAAAEGIRAAEATVALLQAGARSQEVEAARARVEIVEARIARLDEDLRDTDIDAPLAGIVSQKLASAGELVAPRAPLLVLIDLSSVWANVYLDEPLVPLVRLGQTATVVTDAGDAIAGRITYVSPRAEFTPRNVQTAEERSQLVYRVKITLVNTEGILKQGMPVQAEIPVQPNAEGSEGSGSDSTRSPASRDQPR